MDSHRFHFTGDTQAVRIFYGVTAAQNSIFMQWVLTRLNNAPHFLPRWLGGTGLPGEWLPVNQVFLAWIALSAAAAVFPRSRLLRAGFFTVSLYCSLVLTLGSGFWLHRWFETLLALVLVFSRVQDDSDEPLLIHNTFQITQALMAAFLAAGMVPQLFYDSISVPAKIFAGISSAVAMGIAFRIFQTRRSPGNYSVIFMMVVAPSFFFAPQGIPFGMLPALVSLWYLAQDRKFRGPAIAS